MHRSKSLKIIPEDMMNETKIEKRQMEILCDTTSKLIQMCNKKELKVSELKWQPHFSTVFKQLKTQLEHILATDSTKSLEHLNKIPYLLNLKNNLVMLFNNFNKFILENGSLIGTRDHHSRKLFFMKIVHFQFLYFEIQAFFPNGLYTPTNVKISKTPARIWWERKFGDKIFVDLDIFIDAFKEDFPFINQAEIFSFRNSINFTSTNITTIFEYDLFTRLYSPWEKLTEVWRLIYSHPAYLHFSTYGDTKDTLSKYLNEPGTYVFRISCKDLGFWTIGYIKATKEMGQVKVDKSNLIEALVEGHKKNMYLYPNGERTNPDLTNINEFRKEIVVNNDDLKLYECFEDFKECKICRESEKDLQLESCGHQICQSCYKLLRKYDKKLCPFCNQKILSTTKIINVKDSSVYVDASNTKNVSENHYIQMDLPKNSKNNSDNKFLDESKSDIIYTNMTDDINGDDVPPTLPPRVPNEGAYNFKVDSKKTVINYPAITQQCNRNTSSTTNGIHKKAGGIKFGESSSSIYSEMSLSSSSNQNEDHFEDFRDSGIVSNTLPLFKANPLHSKNTSQSKNSNLPRHPNGDMKNQSVTNLSIRMNKVFQSSNEEYSDPNDIVKEDYYCNQKIVKDDDEYFCLNDEVKTDDVYMFPTESDNVLHNDAADDDYMMPCKTQIESKKSIPEPDEMYCDPNDDDDDSTIYGDGSLMANWSRTDVQRALRVAKGNEILAKEILMEFCVRQ